MKFASTVIRAPQPYHEIEFPQFQLQGISLAGIETVVCLPQLDIVFDSGRCPEFAVPINTLALTHWHLDHAGGVAIYLGLRRLNSLKPARIIVPESKLEASRRFLEVLTATSETSINYELTSVRERLPYSKRYWIREITNFHTAPSTAYLVEEKRTKLKQEYLGKSNTELVAIKKQGIEIEHQWFHPLVAFSGDTMGEFLTTEARFAQYLIAECSFFGDGAEIPQVRKYGHSHIRDWAQHADQIQSEFVIMIHTSQRYSRDEIQQACEAHLPPSLLQRLTILR